MDYAPIARIVIRYIVGLVIGADAAQIAAGDPDLVTIVAAGVGVGVETVYAVAKRRGWTL